MALDLYDIYFSAKVVEGFDPAKVRQAVARVFRADAAQLDLLFSGTPVRIKQSVDAETAGQYRATLRKAGILIDIKPCTVAAPVAKDPNLDDAPPLSGMEVTEDDPLFELLPANTGSLADCAPPTPAPPIVDIDGWTLDALGTLLAENQSVPDADIDISELSASPPNSGSLEDCVEEKAPYKIPDISHIRVVDD